MARFYKATDKDLDDLFEFGKKFWREFRHIDIPTIDEDKLFKTLDVFCQKGVILCARDEKKDNLIASLGLVRQHYWWSNETVYNVYWLYVLPEYRNYKTVKTLIDMVKQIAKEDPIYFQISSEKDYDDLFTKFGFKEVGKNWRYN